MKKITINHIVLLYVVVVLMVAATANTPRVPLSTIGETFSSIEREDFSQSR